jgi:hypothetical protein
MSDYDVGYGKPPKHSQFKKGVCPNPRGRGKRQDLNVGEIMNEVLNSKTEFRERGKLKEGIPHRVEHQKARRIGGQGRRRQRRIVIEDACTCREISRYRPDDHQGLRWAPKCIPLTVTRQVIFRPR